MATPVGFDAAAYEFSRVQSNERTLPLLEHDEPRVLATSSMLWEQAEPRQRIRAHIEAVRTLLHQADAAVRQNDKNGCGASTDDFGTVAVLINRQPRGAPRAAHVTVPEIHAEQVCVRSVLMLGEKIEAGF